MKGHVGVALMVILVAGIVIVPTYADTPHAKTKADLTKNLKVPAPNPYANNHLTNVPLNSIPLKSIPAGKTGRQDIQKAQGNYVAGQPWGISAVTAKQATQATQAQNSHQAQNAHQATQAQQAHENQPSHAANALTPLTKNTKPSLKLP